MSKIALLFVILFFSTSFYGKTLTLALYPSLDKAYLPLIEKFQKKYPDIKVELKVKGISDHHNNLLSTIVTGNEVPDVASVEIAYIGQYGNSGAFENLSKFPYRAGRFKDNIVPSAWNQASLDSGTLIGFPVDIGPMCAYWRTDLLKKAGVDYQKIRTMDDLFAAGKKLTRDNDGDGKKDQWIVAEYGVIFNMILKSDATRYFDQNGKPVLNRPLIKEAARWARKFYNAGLCATTSVWSSEWQAAMANPNGGIIFQPAGAWLESQLSGWIAPKMKDRYRVSNLPALVKGNKPMFATDGGSFLVIPSKSKNKEAAWRFIEFIATENENQIATFQSASLFPAWKPAWKDPVFLAPSEYLGGQNARKLWMSIAENIPAVYVNEKDSMAATILSAHIAEAIINYKDIDPELDLAQQEIEAQME